MQISLHGRVALVTGASRGIGRAIAGTLADAGANVMLTARKQDQLDLAAAEIAESGATGETAVFAANAGDVSAARACVAATIERFGGLDILVNNAATNPYYGPTLGVDEVRFDKTVQVRRQEVAALETRVQQKEENLDRKLSQQERRDEEFSRKEKAVVEAQKIQ